ncbi:MAG: aconitate hydratase [Bacillota bacterium]|jgi:aconitate hydratase
MNLTEKIIAAHLVDGSMEPGAEVALKIDQTLTQDALGTVAYLAFETMGISRVRTRRSVSYIDHNMLCVDNKNPDDHAYLLSVARKYGIYLSRAGNGICHSIHCGRFAVPGETLAGGDSHTPSCGAVGMLGIGVGGMDVAAAMAGEPLVIRMPEVVNIRLTGEFRPGVSAKDLALTIVSTLTVKGGNNTVLEYSGPALRNLSVPERFTVANMGAETGATSSIFPADEQVYRFFRAQNREHDYRRLAPDDGACYGRTLEFDLADIEPVVARPYQPDNVCPVKDLGTVKVDQVFIGSCTNSSYADLKTAAAVLDGHVVPAHVSLVISPGTLQNYRMLARDGILDVFLRAGARILECGCGPCVGMGQAPMTGGVSVRTSNRNFRGRSGAVDSQVYLASPAVAAASAVAGYICSADAVIDVYRLGGIHEPDEYPADDNMIVAPAPDGSSVEIVRGPNIKPVPLGTPIPDTLSCSVAIKVGDNVSTDEIAPTGAEIGALRSNIPASAKTVFARIDPNFHSRALSYKNSVIVAGENYGQGSSREHAALLPQFLGVKVVLAKSFSRIHRTNLINCGILPLVFKCPADLEHVEQGDHLIVRSVLEGIESGSFRLENATQGRTIDAVGDFTARERRLLLAGGLLNAIRGKAG